MSELTRIAAKQQPARRRSKLEPYLDDLRKLQHDGYSLEQLKTFLGEIGVIVSRQSIYDFLKRREATTTKIDAHKATTPTAEKSEEKRAGGRTKDAEETKVATHEELKKIARGTINPDQFLDDS